jgi:hypothetical protein
VSLYCNLAFRTFYLLDGGKNLRGHLVVHD